MTTFALTASTLPLFAMMLTTCFDCLNILVGGSKSSVLSYWPYDTKKMLLKYAFKP